MGHVRLPPSDAVDELIRAAPAGRASFRQRTANLGLRVDVGCVADALEHLDGHGDSDFARFGESAGS